MAAQAEAAFYKRQRGSLCVQSSVGDLAPLYGAAGRSFEHKRMGTRHLAILTSGGDSQGMNAAVRATVRSAIVSGAAAFAVQDGYDGLVRGGSHISPISWGDVGGILHLVSDSSRASCAAYSRVSRSGSAACALHRSELAPHTPPGGTVLGTARSAEFRTEEGRRKAVLNLLQAGINHIVVIGGDGSLTGMAALFECWSECSGALLEEHKESAWFKEHWHGRVDDARHLQAVGLIGSIDNDMAETDMTIGCDSALMRICDAIDQLSSTGNSHQREFVVEVMGRNCGWLALKAAIAAGADFCFFPEHPVAGNWAEQLTSTIAANKARGRRSSIIVVSEGAVDEEFRPVKSHEVMQALCDAGYESRVTILGHVQRGGSPSSYDRVASMLLGDAAVKELLFGGKREPQIVCIDGLFETVVYPARACLEANAGLVRLLTEKRYEEAMAARGLQFMRAFAANGALQTRARKMEPGAGEGLCREQGPYGVVHIGACAPGMNAIVRALARFAACSQRRMLGFVNGLAGLHDCDYRELGWTDVDGWAPLGGAALGTTRMDGLDLDRVAETVERLGLAALFVVGGWDGFMLLEALHCARATHPSLCRLELMAVPCSISNNLPGTDYSVGFDTALNCIMEAVDKIKLSAIAHRRVFVVEVMGGTCGYLATFSALATGAELTFVHEEEVTLASLQASLDFVHATFKQGKHMAIIMVSEKASKTFDTSFIAKLFKGKSAGLYDVRRAVLGHLQQGGTPSPCDRCLSVELANYAIDAIVRAEEKGSEQGSMRSVGVRGGSIVVTPDGSFMQDMDRANRRCKTQPWLKKVADLNAKYASVYDENGVRGKRHA